MMRMKFFAPPAACTRFPCAVPVEDMPRHRRRSHEGNRPDERMREDGVHHLAAAMHEI